MGIILIPAGSRETVDPVEFSNRTIAEGGNLGKVVAVTCVIGTLKNPMTLYYP